MITQGFLSNSMGSAKALAGSHPLGLGVVVGLGAYYVVNKYLLNNDSVDVGEEDISEEVAEDIDVKKSVA